MSGIRLWGADGAKMKAQLALLTLSAAMLTACITTQQMPLAPKVIRIDTQASGLLFTGQTVPQTMRAAAKDPVEALRHE